MELAELESNSPDENPWPHLSNYVNFVSKSGEQLLFECKLCLPKISQIKAHTSSLNNLKQHMKRAHEPQYVRFEETVRAGSNRGKPKRKMDVANLDSGESSSNTSNSNPNQAKKKRQRSIAESFGVAATGSGVSQASVDRCIVNFFIANMIPLHAVESKSFGKLIKTLNPTKNSISRRTLGRRIVVEHRELKQQVITLLGKIEWLATTADCWSAHNKSYLGMTVHWIDPVTRARMHAVLACTRLKGRHTYDVLAQAMIDVHYEFHIDKKITRTTTDNGSNFVKAFVQFGAEIDTFPDLPSQENQEIDSEPDDAAGILSEPSEDDEIEFISIENLLTLPEHSQHSADEDVDSNILENFNTLPVHMRCAAHTFNLIASKDADAALRITLFKTPYRNAMAKARALWNQQSRSTVAADSIHNELNRRLVVPNTTRWNSTFDAIVVLNAILEERRPALHRVMTQFKIQPFNDQDVTILKEYVKVMAPVAGALDRIQGEDQANLGTLLPTIAATVLKLKSIKSTGLVNCAALANALLSGIEKRFGPFMEDEHCQMAAAFHPKFRLLWLQAYDNNKTVSVKKRMEIIIEEAINEEEKEVSKDKDSSSAGGGSSNNEEEEEDFFSTVTQPTDRPNRNSRSTRSKAQNLAKIWLEIKSKNSFDDGAFLGEPILIKLFLKYNTSIPSSAAVERLFSTGKDILSPKRASLSDDNFNMLMFMKGNMHLMADASE